VIHNDSMLKNLRKADRPMVVSGIGGKITATMVGDLYIRGVEVMSVYYHPKSLANILCMYDVERKFKVTYDSVISEFVVHLAPDKAARFSEKYKLHVFNQKAEDKLSTAEGKAFVQTVEENESKYTKREVELAQLSIEAMRRLGNPSVKDFVHALTHGDITNSPITARDVHRAVAIYGPSLAVLKGSTVRRKPEQVKIDASVIKPVQEGIVICIDYIFVAGLVFLLSVSRRLNLIMVRYVTSRGIPSTRVGMEAIIAKYRSEGFRIHTWVFDGEKSFGALTPWLQSQGMNVNPTAKNEHVPEVERAARQVKERVRGFWNTLPFLLTSMTLVYLVYYCVTTVNMFPKSSMVGGGRLSPRELFSGQKIDYLREGKLGFGDYVQVHEDDMVTNTMSSRTLGAISLGPTGNLQGSYKFLNLSTWKVITRRSWTALPMPREVQQVIDKHALDERRKGGHIIDRSKLVFELGDSELVDEVEAVDVEQEVQVAGVEDDIPIEPVMLKPPSEHDILYPTGDKHERDHMEGDMGGGESDGHAGLLEPGGDLPTSDGDARDIVDHEKAGAGGDEPAKVLSPIAEAMEQVYRAGKYELRSKRSDWKNYHERFDEHSKHAFTNYTVRKGMKELGLEAVVAMMSEMKQMHIKRVMRGVHFKDISKTKVKKIIKSLMFVKRKRDGRLKARFCANPKGAERVNNDDYSSPTVTTEAIFISSAIDAFERRLVATVDVEGAFLNVDMIIEVYMEISAEIAAMLVELYPEEYGQYIEPSGKMFVLLQKALYGCIESAKLFYDHVSKTLLEFGYERNPYDVCVFNKMCYGKQCTITIHVDDLKISCADPRGVDEVIAELNRVYKKVNVCRDKVIDYLGMEFDYRTDGAVKISMQKMIEAKLTELEITGTTVTPATNDLFTVSEGRELLVGDQKEKFHALVAWLLYIAKRGRPDTLRAVSFLTTRVAAPTEEDWTKLMRVFKYLNGTRELVLTLCGSEGMVIAAYIDAAFAVHNDGKGHTGMTIMMGGGSAYNKSSKQKLVAKSSTEAELIGISDGLSPLLWARNFLEAQGYEMGEVPLHQDNKSTMILAERGKSVSGRTRHVSIRYFFVKDRIESKEIKIVHTGTEDMIADFFTKPLQGALFVKHRKTLLNLA